MIAEELLATRAQLAPLDPAPCPVQLTWSAQDRLLPADVFGARARQLIPSASFTLLADVGHVPMLDDPALVARTILASTSAASEHPERSVQRC